MQEFKAQVTTLTKRRQRVWWQSALDIIIDYFPSFPCHHHQTLWMHVFIVWYKEKN
jgi:hypothetical protein